MTLPSLSVWEQKRADYPEWAYTLAGAMFLFFAIFGSIGNITTLRIFATNQHLQSSANIFIIGLSVCNLCAAVFGGPLAAVAAFAGEWTMGRRACVFEAFVVYVCGLTSLYIITAISIDRYLRISKPFKSSVVTKRSAASSVIACVAGGVFWALPPLFRWNSYGMEMNGVTCGLQYNDHSLVSTSYIIAILLFCFVLPLCIIMFCYCNVYRAIRSTGTVQNRSRSTVRIAGRNTRLKKKVRRTSIAVVVSFWVCWAPYAVVSLWQAFGNMDDMPLTFTLLPVLAVKSQIVLNPIVYVATNAQFRLAFFKCLPCASLRAYLTQGQGRRPAGTGGAACYSLRQEATGTRTNDVRVALPDTPLVSLRYLAATTRRCSTQL